MGDIGIGVRVDTRELNSAITGLERLAELKKQSGGDINIPIEVLSTVGSVRAGNIGGSTEKAARSAGQFRREMESSRKVTSDIVRDFDKLIKIGAGLKGFKPDTFGPPVSPVSSAESSRMRKEAAREAAAFWASVNSATTPPRKTAAQQYFEQHGNHGTTVTSRDDDGGGSGSSGRSGNRWSNSSPFRRALGYGMTAAGVMGIGALIGSARQSYLNANEQEAELFGRGLTGSRKRAGLLTSMGYSPHESYQLESALSRFGLSEKTGIGTASMLTGAFSRAYGIDSSDVIGLRDTVYRASGSNSKIPDSLLMAMSRATATGLDRSQMKELLSLTARNTGATAAAMHGAGISSAQVATAETMALLGLKDKSGTGTFLKSQELFSTMQNGLSSAGSPMGNILLFKALGGYDGPMSFEKIHAMNSMKQGGFLERPDLLKQILSQLPAKSVEGRAGALESIFPDWKLGAKGSKLLIEMADKGYLDKLQAGKGDMTSQLQSMAKNDPEAARMLAELKGNQSLSRMALQSEKELELVRFGERIGKFTEDFERGVVKFGDAILDKNWQKALSGLDGTGKTFLAAAGLIAAGGAMSTVGGILGMGKNVAGGVGAVLPMLRGLMNPLTGAAVIGGSAMYFGAQNDAAMKTGLTDNQLQHRLNQLEVAGAGNGPEADRIRAEQAKRKKTGSGPRPAGYFQYRDVISAASQKHGVPEHLLAGLIESESGFVNHPNRDVKLKNGSTIRVGGMGQFTDETAKRFKIDKMNPYQAIDGTARYLHELYGTTGDWGTAISKYKGVQSPEKLWQVETAISASRKYQAADGGTSDTTTTSTNQMIVDILKVIAGHTEKTAINSGHRPTLTPLPVSSH